MAVTNRIRRALRNALGITRDQEEAAAVAAGLRRDVDAIAATLQRAIGVQDHNTRAAAKALGDHSASLGDLQRRLGTYERSIPSLNRARKALDAGDARKAKAAAAAEATAEGQPAAPDAGEESKSA